MKNYGADGCFATWKSIHSKWKIYTNPLDECVMKGHAQKNGFLKNVIYVLYKHMTLKIHMEV